MEHTNSNRASTSNRTSTSNRASASNRTSASNRASASGRASTSAQASASSRTSTSAQASASIRASTSTRKTLSGHKSTFRDVSSEESPEDPKKFKPSFNMEELATFSFDQIDDCPVFYPTEAEFEAGPIKYINKIHDKAVEYGICKIIPPKSFMCPFVIDPDNFHFTPRLQRIGELEALTRIKLNFHDKLCRFWDLQGVQVKVPMIERKYLELFTFHGKVKDEGGFDTCTVKKKWGKIAQFMGYSKNAASALRNYYERFLLPYDFFMVGMTTTTTTEGSQTKEEIKTEEEIDVGDENDIDVELETKEEIKFEKEITTGKKIETKGDIKNGGEDSSITELSGNVNGTSDRNNDEISNSELKKLQVYGAGPKMPGILANEIAFSSIFCSICNQSSQISSLLTCKKCRQSFHKTCLFPAFSEISKGKWHCHPCIKFIFDRLPESFTKHFGFTQSLKSYSLREFGQMANTFKKDYFDNDITELETVEKEFWRIVSSIVENVAVEYGADLFKCDYGSGFPTKEVAGHEKYYVDSPWNLNNLPTLPGSIFQHMNSNIDGMIVPWMYVGMCFSAFCWHNEDHWTYSINYLHWGDPKTWYGIPGSKAEDFENAMQDIAPELFKSQPDLLHHLVTTCNPNLLTERGIPIYRAYQKAGEFVVTFPRSYHAGFNQGFNFAEAVNFATADWIAMGRLSVAHYAAVHRYPVFSHDELIMKMAHIPDKLDRDIAIAVMRDITKMWKNEGKLRNMMLAKRIGCYKGQQLRVKFETLPDDLRQCAYCKTTCFLSALRCPCDREKLVCLSHYDHLCNKCENHELFFVYGFRLTEIQAQVKRFRRSIAEIHGEEIYLEISESTF